jgi:hypothetical protein
MYKRKEELEDSSLGELYSKEREINQLSLDYISRRKKFRENLGSVLNSICNETDKSINRNITIREGSIYKYNTSKKYSLEQIFMNGRNYASIVDHFSDYGLSSKLRYVKDTIEENREDITRGVVPAERDTVFAVYNICKCEDFIILYEFRPVNLFNKIQIIQVPTQEKLTDMISVCRRCNYEKDPSLNYHYTQDIKFSDNRLMYDNPKYVTENIDRIIDSFNNIIDNLENFYIEEINCFDKIEKELSKEIMSVKLAE